MSHPSAPPHSSHVESRSRKALRSYIIQAATLLEIVLSGLVLIGLLFSGLREKNFITMSEEAQYYFDGSSSVRKLTGILTFIAEWIFIASSINGGAKYLQFLTGMDVLVSKIVCVLAFGVYVYVGGYLAVV